VTQRYEYWVDLRFHHPSMDPADITRALRMRPQTSWRIGEKRRSLAGASLLGQRTDTYWSKRITPGGARVPDARIAELRLISVLQRLRKHARFFKKLQRTGGRAEIWLSSHSSYNYSFTFTPAVLRHVGSLGCDLIVDIYPYRQRLSA